MLNKRKYLIELGLGVIVVTVCMFFILNFFSPTYCIPLFVAIPILTFGMGYYFYRMMGGVADRPEQVFKAFVINFFIKLTVCISTIGIVYFINKNQIIAFVFVFFVYYLGLLVFETRKMMKLIKSQK